MSKPEEASPMARRVLDGLLDRSPRHLPPDMRQIEAGSHLSRVIGRTNSGKTFLIKPEVAVLLGIEAMSLGYTDRKSSKKARELGASADPSAVFEGLDKFLANIGIMADHDDPKLAAQIVVDIRHSLITGSSLEICNLEHRKP